MKCRTCGRELLDSGKTLIEEELRDFELCLTKETCAMQALRPDVLNALELKDAELYAYVKANTDTLAEARMLQALRLRGVKERLALDGEFVLGENGAVLVHADGGEKTEA